MDLKSTPLNHSGKLTNDEVSRHDCSIGCMCSVMMAEAFGMRLVVVGGCVGAACSRPVAMPSMARLAARRATPCSNKLWARASIGKREQRTQPQARSQRPWLTCYVSCGVRAHAQLPAVDLKSTPLTTRAN